MSVSDAASVDTPRRAFSVAVFARDPQGRVLLIRHKRLDTWLPVGGEIEAGETPLEAARRELKEETGLDGRFKDVALAPHVDGAPVGLAAYEEHMAGSKGLHMNFCFVADVNGVPRSNGEWDEHQFVHSARAMSCPENVKDLVDVAHDGHPLASIARAWLLHFNARDLDALLSLYADDAVHVSPKLRDKRPETQGEIRGKAALRDWWQDAFSRLPGLHYAEKHVTASGERVFLEYVRSVPGESDLVVAELFVVRAGRIVESRVFHG
jgi:8-oxo-dGTP diphosphatase